MPVEFFKLSFRVVRLKISDKTIETLITNLDFPPDELKKIYNMRWSIETSFRDLKYTLKTLKIHAKNLEYARHEIFAGLIMYNFSAVVKISREYFLDKLKLEVMEQLTSKLILPVRKGRNNPRKILPKPKVSFMYR